MARKDEFDQFLRKRRALTDISSTSNRILSLTKVPISKISTCEATTNKSNANRLQVHDNAITTLSGSKMLRISKAKPGNGIKISHLKHLAPMLKPKTKHSISLLNLPHILDKKVNGKAAGSQSERRTSSSYNGIVAESNRAIEKFDNWFKIHKYNFQGNKRLVGIEEKPRKKTSPTKPIYEICSVNPIGLFLVAVGVKREREKGTEGEVNGKGKYEKEDKRNDRNKRVREVEKEGEYEEYKEDDRDDEKEDVRLLMNGSQINLEVGNAVTLGQWKLFTINGGETRVYSTWRVLRDEP